MYRRLESSRDRILATMSYNVSIKQYKTVDFLLLFFFLTCVLSPLFHLKYDIDHTTTNNINITTCPVSIILID